MSRIDLTATYKGDAISTATPVPTSPSPLHKERELKLAMRKNMTLA